MKRLTLILMLFLFTSLCFAQTEVKSLKITNGPTSLNDSTQVDILVRERAGVNKGMVRKVTWPYIASLIGNIIPDHNELNGLQGGNGTNEFVHLTFNERDSLHHMSFNFPKKADLDVNGKVPLSQINDALIGAVNYQGTYNASNNTPPLPSATGNKGKYWIVSTAGTQQGLNLSIGDWIISNGSVWGKVDNNNAVVSVAGKTGAVTLSISDIIGLNSALLLKADLASPNFTGTPTAPTATAGTSTTQIATTEFAQNAANAKVAQTINDGVTTSAPSQDVVYDALILKSDSSNTVGTRETSTGYTTLFSGDLNTLPPGNYTLAISGTATNGPTGIGTSRAFFNFGARSGTDTGLVGQLMIGTTGIAFRNTPTATWTIIATNSYADAKVANDLTASTTIAPSKTAVNTALALKSDITTTLTQGTNIPNGADLNTYVNTGLFSQITAANATLPLNYPTTEIGQLEVVRGASNQIYQKYHSMTSNVLHIRRMAGASWSNWRRMVNDVEIDTKVTKGGDTNGADLIIGTNDNFDLVLRYNGINRYRFNVDGLRVVNGGNGSIAVPRIDESFSYGNATSRAKIKGFNTYSNNFGAGWIFTTNSTAATSTEVEVLKLNPDGSSVFSGSVSIPSSGLSLSGGSQSNIVRGDGTPRNKDLFVFSDSTLPVSGFVPVNTAIASGDTPTVIASKTQGQINAKQDVLVSGTNIKTVGGQTLLGSGDVTEVQNSLTASTVLAPSATAVNTALANKFSQGGDSFGFAPSIGTNDANNFFLKYNNIQKMVIGTSVRVIPNLNIDANFIVAPTSVIRTAQGGGGSIVTGDGSSPMAFVNTTGLGAAPAVSFDFLAGNLPTTDIIRWRIGSITSGVNINGNVFGSDATSASHYMTKGQFDALFLTNTSPLDFASTAAGSSSDLTINVSGAVVGDTVILAPPTASILNNSCYTAWVSAANTVTVRFNNYSSAPQNPASGSFKVKIIK